MKRFLIFALMAAFVMGTVSMGSAAELKVKGEWKFSFAWVDNFDFVEGSDDNESEDDFEAAQRARLYFEYIANENLKGIFGIEIGDSTWGLPGDGADFGADDKVIEVKRSMIQFTWPETDLMFKVGVQGIALPSATFGSPIHDDDSAGIVASYAFSDQVALTALWTRLLDDQGQDDSPAEDEIDAFAVIVPVTLDGASITPFFFYATAGQDVAGAVGGLNGFGAGDEDLNAYWLGAAVEIDAFDPFTIAFDAYYGTADAGEEESERSGFFAAALVEYGMDFGDLGVFGWYATGEDDDTDNGSEQLPTVSGTFGPTTFGTDGSALAHTSNESLLITADGISTMGVGAQLANFSFVDGLKHTLRVAYIAGTSDEDAPVDAMLRDDASFFEVNFDHQYKIYENLAAIAEIGYINADFDDNDDTSDAMKLAMGLKYKF